MNPDSTLHKAIELAKKATQEDEAGNYPEAIRLYSSAIDYFMHVTKFEKPPEATKKQIRSRMEEYLSRAEVLKTCLQKKASRPIKASDGGGTKKGDKNTDDDDDDDKEAKKLMSKMEGAIIEKPNVKFSDVAGLDYAKQALEEAVMLPIKFPNMFTGKRKPWKGILLYGPPGTGKSFLAKAVATEANQSTFFCISSSDIVTKWLGESEKMVKNLFQLARLKAPSIIFIDEVDSLCSARSDSESESSRRIKTEFLVQMQGAGSEANNVLVLAATNIPWCIDDGFRRRFQRRIYIPLPDEKARFALFKMNLNENAHSLSDDDFTMLAKKTENYSGADIYNIALQAIYEPLRKVKTATHFKRVSRPSKEDKKVIVHDMLIPCSPGDPNALEMSYSEVPADKLVEPDVTLNDVLMALAELKPSVSLEDLEKFEKFTRDYGSDGS